MSSLELAIYLLKVGNVSTCPGSVWGKNGEGYLSLGISTSQENILEGLKRLERKNNFKRLHFNFKVSLYSNSEFYIYN